VISRILGEAKVLMRLAGQTINPSLFRNRYRTARRISRAIDSWSKALNQTGQQKRPIAYTKLIAVTTAAMKQAHKVKLLLEDLNSVESQKLLKKWQIFSPRIEQVVSQASRRIFNHEKVSAAEKIVSIFEVHTAIICRGKINLDVEFGRKVWLDEVDGDVGMKRWVGWGIIAHNLTIISRALVSWHQKPN
jgi:transposase, IS5 family